MKSEYDFQNTTASLFGNEALLQLITNLEKLDLLQGDVLDNLNQSLIQRRAKLENLHSRIIRIFQILKFLETVPQALTILSKKFYPENIESFISKSIYYNDICDFNLASQCLKYKGSKSILNDKLLNNAQELGKPPSSDMEDIKLSQDILNSLTQYRGMREKAVITNSSNLLEHERIDKQVEMLTSIFTFTTRIKVFGDEIEKSTKILHQDSKTLDAFIKKKDKRDLQKPIFSAPETLISDSQIRNFERHKETVKHKTIANIDDMIGSKIKNTIGILGSVVDIEINNEDNNHNFKYMKYDDSNVEYDYGGEVFASDDIGHYETPMDKIKNAKIKPAINPNTIKQEQVGSSNANTSTYNPNAFDTSVNKPPNQIIVAPKQQEVISVPQPIPTVVVPTPIVVSNPSNIPPVPLIVAPKAGNIPKPPPLILPVPKPKAKPVGKPDDKKGDEEVKKEEPKKIPPKDNPVRLIDFNIIDGCIKNGYTA